jgi:hypothetical protein
MGKRYPELLESHQTFIAAQPLFFVATAAPEGRVNVSPKGMDSLRVLSPTRIVWRSVTGSGNETAAHLLESPRMTLMWCAFEGRPLILRAYGEARAVYPGDPDWDALITHFPALPGTRSLFDVRVDLVQTSCGMAVPYFDYAGDRDDLNRWAENKGEDGLRRYRQEKNAVSLDGKPCA